MSHVHRFIWVSNCKAASMQMQAAVAERIGIPAYQYPFPPWATCSLAAVAERTDYFRFAAVRNPWARLLSCYLDKIMQPARGEERFILAAYGMQPGMPFADFVQRVAAIPDPEADAHFVSQWHRLSRDERLLVDYVVRFEDLPAAWEPVQQRCGVRALHWAPVGSQRPQGDHYYHRPYYTPELVECVRQRFARDAEMFRYAF